MPIFLKMTRCSNKNWLVYLPCVSLQRKMKMTLFLVEMLTGFISFIVLSFSTILSFRHSWVRNNPIVFKFCYSSNIPQCLISRGTKSYPCGTPSKNQNETNLTKSQSNLAVQNCVLLIQSFHFWEYTWSVQNTLLCFSYSQNQ